MRELVKDALFVLSFVAQAAAIYYGPFRNDYTKGAWFMAWAIMTFMSAALSR